MLISLQYTALYRIGSKYEYIMSVCMTWVNFFSIWLISGGQAECSKRRRINYYKSKQRLLFLASKFVLETRYAGHTHTHAHAQAHIQRSRTNRSRSASSLVSSSPSSPYMCITLTQFQFQFDFFHPLFLRVSQP